MQAIMWHGLAGPIVCDAQPQLVDGTDALVWTVGRNDRDLDGVVVDVGDEVCSFEVGDFVTVAHSAGSGCCSSSLWGLTEFVEDDRFGHLARVPLAEMNLFLVRGSEAS